MEVPSKEVQGVVESIFGKVGAKIVIGIIAVGASITAIGGAWNTLKGIYDGAAPFIPSAIPEWVTRLSSSLLVTALAFYAGKKLRELNQLKRAVAQLTALSEGASSEEPEAAKAKVRSLEDRVNYLESQVGDQLTNLLVGQTLKQQGIQVGPIQREFSNVVEPGMDSRWSVEEKHLITRGRALLFEAAQEARKSADAKGDLDKLTNQAWLIMQIRSMITEGFGFRLFKEIEDELEIRDKKRKHDGKSANAAETLNYLADFCEATLPGLKPEDVAELYKLPPTFAEFMKSQA